MRFGECECVLITLNHVCYMTCIHSTKMRLYMIICICYVVYHCISMIIWGTHEGLLVVFGGSLASVKVVVTDRHVICVYIIVYIYIYVCVYTHVFAFVTAILI